MREEGREEKEWLRVERKEQLIGIRSKYLELERASTAMRLEIVASDSSCRVGD